MKKLIMIGGAMGTGKTTAAELLVNAVPRSAMLDGDWCWQQGCDWHFDAESRDMVMRNICFVLENLLKNSHIENVFFAWVLHLRETRMEIVETLRDRGCAFALTEVSLMLNADALRERLEARARADAARMDRALDYAALDAQVARAMERMRCFDALGGTALDASGKSPWEVAAAIAARAGIALEGGPAQDLDR